MEKLLEDYERRLKTINKIIDDLRFKDDANPDYIRLITKASCYRTIISEIQREMREINIDRINQMYSEDFKKWVKQSNLPPLTNTQRKFSEWLLIEENQKMISQIGSLEGIFSSVYEWIKKGKP